MICVCAIGWVGVGAELRKDIEYSRPDGVALKLDASIPDGPGPHAAVIIVHGGGFVRGDKQTYVPPLFPPLTDAGIAWFSIDYRLAPAHKFPAPVDDVRAAFAYVTQHAKEFRVDPKRIGLVGESAGATIAAYYAATEKGKYKPKAVVDLYGVVDWEFNREVLGKLSEGATAWLGDSNLRNASAITHIHKGMPPFLFIHGTKDPQVPFAHSPRMCAAMRLIHAECEVFVVEGGGHGMGGWEKDPAMQAYKKKLVEWLKERMH